jgi:pyruvate/2-oxoglutarate dehydrogenase complex dihydrolipoamide acyltransferase (E2) component
MNKAQQLAKLAYVRGIQSALAELTGITKLAEDDTSLLASLGAGLGDAYDSASGILGDAYGGASGILGDAYNSAANWADNAYGEAKYYGGRLGNHMANWYNDDSRSMLRDLGGILPDSMTPGGIAGGNRHRAEADLVSERIRKDFGDDPERMSALLEEASSTQGIAKNPQLSAMREQLQRASLPDFARQNMPAAAQPYKAVFNDDIRHASNRGSYFGKAINEALRAAPAPAPAPAPASPSTRSIMSGFRDQLASKMPKFNFTMPNQSIAPPPGQEPNQSIDPMMSGN